MTLSFACKEYIYDCSTGAYIWWSMMNVFEFVERIYFAPFILKDLNTLLWETRLGVCAVTHMTLVAKYQQPNVTPPVRWDQENVVGCWGAQSIRQQLQVDCIWDVLSTMRIEIYRCWFKSAAQILCLSASNHAQPQVFIWVETYEFYVYFWL